MVYVIQLTLALYIVLTAFASVTVLASETNGVIQTGSASSLICKDVACATYGNVNWKPSDSTPVSITDSGLTGYIWGDEIGWVNLAPTGAGVSINSTTGELSGYAFANTGSWINFSPTDVSGGGDVGVTIDSNGQFTGWAWVSGVNGGWMKFDCSSGSTCVKTDWRPVGSRTTTSSSGGGSTGTRIKKDETSTTTSATTTATSTADQGTMGSTDNNSAAPIYVPPFYQNNTAPLPPRPVQIISQGEVNGEEQTPTPPEDFDTYPDFYNDNSTGGDLRDETQEKITRFYREIDQIEPIYYGANHVKSFNAPLAVREDQSALLVWDFSAEKGGVGKDKQAVVVEIPSGAVASQVTFNVEMLPANDSTSPRQSKEVRAYIVDDILYKVTATDESGQPVHSFTEPIKISLFLPGVASTESGVGVYYLDEERATWVRVSGAVISDTSANFMIDHLTLFSVISSNMVLDELPVRKSGFGDYLLFILASAGFAVVLIGLYIFWRRKSKA
ncbi:MAG: hypothetical protein H6779_03960 [Candidatus Nomurabacteria bacterium]|nr:MAG: hypothetical protein H6779_03960 [Candidatus Nomurabacteria bacterium]